MLRGGRDSRRLISWWTAITTNSGTQWTKPVQHILGPSSCACTDSTTTTSMECSQPGAWTTNRSFLVESGVKAFPRRPTNSGSTLPKAAHLDGGVIACHQCITSHLGCAPASPDMRPNPWALSHMHAIHHLHPCPHPIHHSHDQLHTCTNCY